MDYAGYHVPTDSPLIRLWDAVYRENTGQALGLTYMHSALDAGTICERLGFGYDCGHAHRAGCTYPTGAYECGFLSAAPMNT